MFDASQYTVRFKNFLGLRLPKPRLDRREMTIPGDDQSGSKTWLVSESKRDSHGVPTELLDV